MAAEIDHPAPAEPGLMDCIRIDWRANRSNFKAHLVLTIFRIAHCIAVRRESAPLLWFAGLPVILFYFFLVQWVLGIDLYPTTRIGPGLRLYHCQALVVHSRTTFGRGCSLRQSTTIGTRELSSGDEGVPPTIGDFVEIGCNAVILGPITIGDKAVIGAGSVVLKDVPPHVVVAGNPARIIRYLDCKPEHAANC